MYIDKLYSETIEMDFAENRFNNKIFYDIVYLTYGKKKIPVVIKEYISGPTLENAILNNLFFNSNKLGQKMRIKFLEFCNQIINSGYIPGDLKPPNIMWNPETKIWILIDYSLGEKYDKFNKRKKNLYIFFEKFKYIYGNDSNGNKKKK